MLEHRGARMLSDPYGMTLAALPASLNGLLLKEEDMTNEQEHRGDEVELIAQADVALPTGEMLLAGTRISGRRDIENSPPRFSFPAKEPAADITDLVKSGDLKFDQRG